MEWPDLLGFLTIVVAATYIQTVWGFALGLTIVGSVALLGLAPVAVTAAVVSALGLVNATWALAGVHRHIRWRTVILATCAQAPGIAAGLVLLEALSGSPTRAMHALLGICIVASASLLMLRPAPRAIPSPSSATVLTGVVSGVLSGLFSAGGPAWVYYMYRQPLPLPDIRATLLTMVAVSTGLRIVMLGAGGGITQTIVVHTLVSLPAVIAATLLAQRLTPNLSDRNMRRGAFGILIVMGVMLLVR